jgi:hypothetical protein
MPGGFGGLAHSHAKIFNKPDRLVKFFIDETKISGDILRRTWGDEWPTQILHRFCPPP